MNFCTPAEIEEFVEQQTLTGIVIDDFTVNTPHRLNVSCTALGASSTKSIPPLIPKLDTRYLGIGDAGGNGQYTATVSAGTFTVETTANCNLPDTIFLCGMGEPCIIAYEPTGAAKVDYTPYSVLRIPVTSLTGGPVSGCRIALVGCNFESATTIIYDPFRLD